MFLPERKKCSKTGASLINYLSITKAVTGFEELLLACGGLCILCTNTSSLALKPALYMHLLTVMARAIISPPLTPEMMPRAASMPGGGSR